MKMPDGGLIDDEVKDDAIDDATEDNKRRIDEMGLLNNNELADFNEFLMKNMELHPMGLITQSSKLLLLSIKYTPFCWCWLWQDHNSIFKSLIWNLGEGFIRIRYADFDFYE